MKRKQIPELFRSILLISSLTFGGGLAMIAMMQRRFVEELHWLEEDEMLDITAMAQAVPGPAFISAAIMVGFRLAGILGAIAAVTAAVIPPLVILSLISAMYTQIRENRVIALFLQVMRAGVAAYLLDVLIGMVQKLLHGRRALYILMAAAVFAARQFFQASISMLFVTCLAIGVADLLWQRRRGGAE